MQHRPAWARRRPWGCPLCMGWWSSLLVTPAVRSLLEISLPGLYPDLAAGAVVLLASTGLAALLGALALPPPLDDLPEVEP